MRSFSLYSDCRWNGFSKTEELRKQLPFALCIYTLLFIRAILWEQNPWFWQQRKIKSKVKNKIRHAVHKSKVSRLTIIKIIRTKHRNRAWLSLILYCMQSSLLPLFYCHTLTELSFLMTTSYLVLWLTLLKISITKGRFFSFWLPVKSYSDFWYYRSLLYYGKFTKIRKNQGQIKNNIP